MAVKVDISFNDMFVRFHEGLLLRQIQMEERTDGFSIFRILYHRIYY